VKGIDQIYKVLKLETEEDCKGYFVTSAKITEEMEKEANSLGIEVMDGERLAELILNNIDALSRDTKIRLGISSVPQMLEKMI
jgi:restriction endonuclease Mrr